VVVVLVGISQRERRVRHPQLPHLGARPEPWQRRGRGRLDLNVVVQHLQHRLHGVNRHGVVVLRGGRVDAGEEVAVALADCWEGEGVGRVAAAELVLPRGGELSVRVVGGAVVVVVVVVGH